ncbi:MAG: ABC transporter permease subunit [Reyranella sp.]|uniref:ABC transporter permease subunit n=1 Tax=Reyranella sp. TaxID=1929291 RepID=UPI001AD5E92A|nr:ABC transporter permease subunit [Reyranella sp.]MBN9090323.1 ABC transporter permease subunit [Reyranella sp.]
MRLVIALPYLWLVVFFLLPLGLVLGLSLATNAPDLAPPVELGLSFASFKLLFTDDLYLAAWLSSLRIAATSTLVCLLLGYPMAYAIARATPPRRPLLLMLVILPFWTSFLIRVYAWMGLLAENGILNQFLRWSGLMSDPGTILGTEWAIHLGIVYAYLPFMVLPLYTALEKLDWSLLEAASDLGARPLPAFLTVTLPLSLPGIVAGCLLVFIPAVGEFVIPDLLGGTRTLMIGKVLWDEFFTNSDWPLASAVAICLLILLVGPILLFQRQQQRSLERT